MALLGESHKAFKDLMHHAQEVFLYRSDAKLSTLRPTEVPTILDTDLTALTKEQRLGFEITVGILCFLSLCGNFSTLYVNSRRKMRPFFRTCLISLALSDLLSTIFLTWTHFPQFTAEYVQIWLLGPFMCRFIPQVTTGAILASSMTLVGIALDRYFAVMQAVVSFWNPGIGFCFLFAFIIWVTSIGIATPVCFIYRTLTIWIMTEVSFPDEGLMTTNDWLMDKSEDVPFYTLLQPKELVTMCVSDQKDVALYYIIVFSIIFVPCIVAFVWLNSIIAKKIWTRRHRVPQQAEGTAVHFSRQNSIIEGNQLKSVYTKESTTKSAPGYNSAREARHIRMFIVIVVLMAVFIILRLPAWIFLVMRMYGTYTKPQDWIVYFSFGVLNLASCALNPLFYTFLPETLQYISCCRQTFCSNNCELSSKLKTTECKAENCLRSAQCESDVPCCICCGIMCRLPTTQSCRCAQAQSVSFSQENTKPQRPLSFELDEGVDCSDASFDEEDYEIRKQEICVVFTTTLNSTYNPQQPQQQQQQQRY